MIMAALIHTASVAMSAAKKIAWGS